MLASLAQRGYNIEGFLYCAYREIIYEESTTILLEASQWQHSKPESLCLGVIVSHRDLPALPSYNLGTRSYVTVAGNEHGGKNNNSPCYGEHNSVGRA